MKLSHYKKINGTAALALTLQSWAELIRSGLSDYIPDDITKSEALIIFPDEAIMTFIEEEDTNSLFIDSGWVNPHHRGKKHYTILWNGVVDIAKERGREYIYSYIMPHNTTMRAIALKQGRIEEIIMDKGREMIQSTFLVK